MIANTVIERCDSTNNLGRQLGLSGYPHGTWISARAQSKGRGRHGREWTSEHGNLFLSVVARPSRTENASWIPIVAAVAACRAIHQLFPKVSIGIKWPNDLWISGKKVGGILCEGVASGSSETFVVIGIGINCASSPAKLSGTAIDLWSSSPDERADEIADHLRTPLIEKLLELLKVLDKDGPEQIAEEYHSMAILKPGTAIRWKSGTELSPQEGTVVGLGKHGELLVKKDNIEQSIFSEEVEIRPTERTGVSK